MKVELTKEMFCTAIDAIESYWRGIQKLEEIVGIHCSESHIINLMDSYIDFITDLMGIEHNDIYGDDISYYMWDCDFGNKWKPNMIVTNDGIDIPLKNAEDLWNLLMMNKEEKDES